MNRKKELFQNVKSLVEKNRQVIFFILRVALIYVAWKLLSWFLGEQSTPLSERHWPWLSACWEQFNNWVRIFLLYSTKFVFDILGYSNRIISSEKLLVPDLAWIAIGNYCLGIQLWVFFVALICSYPIKWKRKLFYSIIGVISINIINILRFIVLIFACNAYPKQIQFNHDYIFNVVVYIFTFIMWILIVRREER
ncbi:MAG: hypothetical protein HGB12_16255 [Bacteroidetes bacterium]|nr:hypothetical protein [Bacteroidota bacterium]